MSARRRTVLSLIAAFAMLVWAGSAVSDAVADGDPGRLVLAGGGALIFLVLTAVHVHGLWRGRGDA